MGDFHPLVSVSETIDAPPSRVWDVATHKTGLMFMGSSVKTDWNEGHSISFKGEWSGKAFEDKGEVKTFEQEKKLAFTHFSPLSGKPDRPENYNLVAIELHPKGAKTEVTLTQSVHRQSDEPSPDAAAEFKKNWQMMLTRLKKEAERAET